MAVLQSSNDVGKDLHEQAKRPVNTAFRQLIEEITTQTIMLEKHLQIDEIQTIVDNLKKLAKAKQFMLHDRNEAGKIACCMSEAKKVIEDKMINCIENIKSFIDNHHFYEADERIDSIGKIHYLLSSYNTDRVSKKIEKN